MPNCVIVFFFFFSSRRRHTRLQGDWSSDVCSSDLKTKPAAPGAPRRPTAPPPPIRTPPKRPPSREPEHLKLIEDVMPDPDLSLEIESTSLMQDAEAPSSPGMLEGLESTQSEYASLAEDGLSTPSL